MGDNECLGWFPRYTPNKPMCNDVECFTQVWDGSQMPSAEDYEKVGSSDATFLPPQTESCGNGFYVVDELPKGIFRTNISTDDADFKRLSEKTAKVFEKSCNDYLETLSEVSKSLNPCLERLIAHFGKTSRRKARKYYKPRFTL